MLCANWNFVEIALVLEYYCYYLHLERDEAIQLKELKSLIYSMFFMSGLKLAYKYKAVFYCQQSFTISLLSPFEAEHSLHCSKLDHDIG